jgi:hypothetical protein
MNFPPLRTIDIKNGKTINIGRKPKDKVLEGPLDSGW